MQILEIGQSAAGIELHLAHDGVQYLIIRYFDGKEIGRTEYDNLDIAALFFVSMCA